MATHSRILAWRIPWSEEPGRLSSTGSQTAGHDCSDLACMLLHSKQIKSRRKPVCLRSLLSPLSMPCLQLEGGLSLTDGRAAAVLRLAAKWDRGGSYRMGSGIKLKVQNSDALMKAMNGEPPEERVIFFTTEGTILKVQKREKTAAGSGIAFQIMI